MAAGLALAGVYLLCGGVNTFGQGDLAALVSTLIYVVWMLDPGRHLQVFGQPVLTASFQFWWRAASP
ncbi:hypothetical protein [Rhodobacter ferrooxidans]|uniref:hypothetical protein n=1 Tax=Rhodobacter ferrooxidans TaxID=371731 RepID=UPI000681D73D|nr:hypothetical protein [Rhodobacter sp. SW2]